MKGSFMGACAKNAGIGFECDPFSEEFLDTVYNYYCGINKDYFYINCDKEMERITEEYYAGKQYISKLLSDK